MPEQADNQPKQRPRPAARRQGQRRNQASSPPAAQAASKRARPRSAQPAAQANPAKAAARAPRATNRMPVDDQARAVRQQFKPTLPGNISLRQIRSQARNRQQAQSNVRPGIRRQVGGWLRSGRIVSLLVFLAAMAGLVYLFVSPRFQVAAIEVEGNSVLPDSVLAELSQLENQSIWFIDEPQVTARLLENAYVEQAALSIAMPNRAVIHISERHPDMRWQVNGIHYMVDRTGRVLGPATDLPESDTLVIVDSRTIPLQPKDYVDPDALELGRLLALRLPREVGLTPALIGWDSGVGVYIQTSADQTVVFGRTDNLDRKLLILYHLLQEETTFTYLDLRPSNPFYR